MVDEPFKENIDNYPDNCPDSDDHFNRVLTEYDPRYRYPFIRKVYGILSAHLCITFGAIAAVKLNPGWNEGFKTYEMKAGSILFIILSIALILFIFK